MRLFLDDNPCGCPADSVAQAIAAGAAIAESSGRMIVEVFVDGEQWNSDKLQDLDTHHAAGEVRLTSADPNDLVSQTLDDAVEALSDVNELQGSAAQLIQSGQEQAAMAELKSAFALWASIQQAVSMSAELADVDLNALSIETPKSDAVTPKQSIQNLNAQLHVIRDALESGDFVALADALLYEMPPVTEQWRELLLQLKSGIGR